MSEEKKAYDLKELINKLKSKGLVVAEDMAETLVVATFEWVEESAIISENKYDDLALAALPLIKSQILEKIDKIDGEIEGA